MHTSYLSVVPAACVCNRVLYMHTSYLSVVPAVCEKSPRLGPSFITELSRVVFMKKNRLA